MRSSGLVVSGIVIIRSLAHGAPARIHFLREFSFDSELKCLCHGFVFSGNGQICRDTDRPGSRDAYQRSVNLFHSRALTGLFSEIDSLVRLIGESREDRSVEGLTR